LARKGFSKGTHILGLIVMLAFSTSVVVYAQEPFYPRSLKVEIFADRVVSIEYSLDVDTTYSFINVPLFGRNFENIIVLNHLGETLDYESIQGGIKIHTLGTYRVWIRYETRDLTRGIGGGVWTFSISSPTNVTVVLPRDADIISLSQSPISIEIVKDKTLLKMLAGDLELVYAVILPVPVLVPPEIPSVPSGASAFDYRGIVPTDFFESIPADKPIVLMFKNFVLITSSSKRLDLSLTVDSDVAMKYFKLCVEPNESLSLEINVDTSPPQGVTVLDNDIDIYLNIESEPTVQVNAILGLHINRTTLEAELGRRVNVSRLSWMYWDGSKWVPVPSRIEADGYLAANATHLSTWSIVEMVLLQVTAELSAATATIGDEVTVYATLKAEAGNIMGATVTMRIDDEIFPLTDKGNGTYEGVMATTGLEEGSYSIVITTEKEGYAAGQATKTLTLQAPALQVAMQLTPETVTQGDTVTISAMVKDDDGNPMDGAAVTASISGKTINLSDQRNGSYKGTVDTAGLKEGTYDVVVSAQKVGYRLSQASQTLTVKAAVPWMLYGGITTVIVMVIVAAVLYKVKRES